LNCTASAWFGSSFETIRLSITFYIGTVVCHLAVPPSIRDRWYKSIGIPYQKSDFGTGTRFISDKPVWWWGFHEKVFTQLNGEVNPLGSLPNGYIINSGIIETALYYYVLMPLISLTVTRLRIW
jgi:hypothetical protein